MASVPKVLPIVRSPLLSASRYPLATVSRFKRAVTIPFRCRSGPSPGVDSEAPEKSSNSSSSSSSLLGIPTSSWCAGLGGLGFLETGYLTFLKLTNSEAFCAVGGGSCSDVLNSDYAYVFGVPLSAIGMVAYGLVVLLALQQNTKNSLSVDGETDMQLILLGITTSMAAASAYFVYLLNTKLAGSPCPYCLTSAILSFSLFFITLKDFGLQNIQKAVGLQLAIAGIVITALSNSYMAIPQFPSANEVTLEPYETEITDQSTPWAISLAKHLHSIGAKMYGAFWCSHCNEQKAMFGREAAKILDYVECFPEGAGKGKKMSKICTDAAIEGFPTWIIKDKVLGGEQELQELARLSGFPLQEFTASQDLS